MNIVIMAGGGGSRLWPLSRQNKPKQFLDLGSGKTLLEHTYDRARVLTEPVNMYVATTREHETQVRELLPDIPLENIFFEPERRDTGPAFAAAAQVLTRLGQGDEPTIFMWSDHVFTNEEEFIHDLQRIPALIQAHPESIVIVGHTPTFPETGLGYLEVSEHVDEQTDVYVVKAFKEKPDEQTAKQYLEAGNYFWNMGYISAKPSFLLKEIERHTPDLAVHIAEYDAAIAAGNEDESQRIYAALEKKSIDYVLLERADNIIAITGDYGWSDVGNWAAVKEIFGTKGDHRPAGHHVHVDSNNNYIYNATKRAVSLIGVENTIVVVADDAVLVCDKDSAHKVKEVVQELEESDHKEYL